MDHADVVLIYLLVAWCHGGLPLLAEDPSLTECSPRRSGQRLGYFPESADAPPVFRLIFRNSPRARAAAFFRPLSVLLSHERKERRSPG